MSRRHVYLVACVTLIAVFALAGIWEFVLEDAILSAIDSSHVTEPTATRWEFTVTAAAFATIATAIFIALSLRVIGERQRARAHLEESEERFGHFADAASDWFWETDARLRFTRVFGRLELDASQFIGKTRRELVDVDADPDMWAAHFADLDARRPFRDLIHAMARPDGSMMWGRISGVPVFDADGKFQGYRGVGSDVTRQIEAEEQARSAQERLAIGVEGLSEQFILCDSDDRIVIANRACREFHRSIADVVEPGTAYEAFLRAGVAAGLYPGAREKTETWLGEMMERHRDPKGPFEVARQNYRWLLVSEKRLADGSTISIASDITQRKEAEQHIQFLAHHDSLTELPNRVLFQDRMELALAQADRSQRRVAVLLLDLDHFKHVNDSLGHTVGDALLAEVGARLKHCIRGGDTIARLGGDEFAVIQAQLDTIDQTVVLAERMIGELSQPFEIEGHMIHTGSSIGITVYPDDSRDIDQLLKNADMALYRAKGEGRGTFEFYSGELGVQAHKRMQFADGLRHALKADQFHLHFQPKANIADGRVVGGEALLRWDHPEHGLISPGDFVPIAEATGLILPIGDWIFERACAQLRDWTEAGLQPVPISVNLSAAQFRDKNLLDKVRASLRNSSVDPSLIEFEITETALMHDPEEAAEILNHLLTLGVQLSIDDFGTGYSSLNYLKQFPLGKLKIDLSFVREITRSPADEAIARAVTHLGHSLGMQVLAEGVETEEQCAILRRIGCDEIQGYLISKPLPPDEFIAFVKQPVHAAFLTAASPPP